MELKTFTGTNGFVQIVDRAARLYPDKVAVISDGKCMTYAQFATATKRLAAALIRDGIGQGDAVALISRNCFEYPVIEFAIMRAGATAVKMNWRFSPEELDYLLKMNEVKMGFMRYEKPEWGECVVRDNPEIRFIMMNQIADACSPYDSFLSGAPDIDSWQDFPISNDAIAIRFHTSGTTGRPKFVEHSHGAMLAKLECCLEVMDYDDTMVYQMVSQMFHAASIGAYLLFAVAATLILLPRFKIDEYLDSIHRNRVTAIGVLPIILQTILDYPGLDEYDLSTLKRINYSTCAMPPVLLKRGIDRFHCRFYQQYGMTEMASIVTVLTAEDHCVDHRKYLASCGRPIPHTDIRIVKEDGSDCRQGETGEVIVRGPGCMQGYYKLSKEANEKVIVDGWYHTKDNGYLDDGGYLFICGRSDDLIISGGENIYPKEVSDAMLSLIDGIKEITVYGMPDERWGEYIKASIVLEENSKLTAEDIQEKLRLHMPHYKVPKVIDICKALPRNTSGKVEISKLKQS